MPGETVSHGSGEQTSVDRCWYACYTRSRHEKRVNALLAHKGIESYLPLAPRVQQWSDRRRTVQWPMFPGYVFGRFSARDLHTVISLPGVSTVVASSGKPVPIGDDELDNVRRFADALANGGLELELRSYIAEGQWVQVTEGPLEGIRGIVIERRNRKRVIVGLRAIGQGLEVDVDTRFLKPIAGP